MDPAWSADQKFIFYASRETHLAIFKNNLKSGEKLLVLKDEGLIFQLLQMVSIWLLLREIHIVI